MINTAIDNAELFAILSSLADSKQVLGWRFAYWSNGAPALEAAVAAAAMTQDELGHARTLYPLLEQFAQGQADLTQVEPMTRTLRYHLAAFDEQFAGWANLVAAIFLLDTALTVFFMSAQESSYEALRVRSRKVVQEERIHFTYAEGWVRRLANAGGAVRSNLAAALQQIWDETLCWFGPDDDRVMQKLAQGGIIDAASADLRQRYFAKIMPTLQSVHLEMPVAFDEERASWELTQPLPWSRWDATTRRLR